MYYYPEVSIEINDGDKENEKVLTIISNREDLTGDLKLIRSDYSFIQNSLEALDIFDLQLFISTFIAEADYVKTHELK